MTQDALLYAGTICQNTPYMHSNDISILCLLSLLFIVHL